MSKWDAHNRVMEVYKFYPRFIGSRPERMSTIGVHKASDALIAKMGVKRNPNFLTFTTDAQTLHKTSGK